MLERAAAEKGEDVNAMMGGATDAGEDESEQTGSNLGEVARADFSLGRVFERFYSLPRPDGQRKSTGLGLSFVREIARLHRGRVSLYNRAEGGVEVEMILNRNHQEREDAASLS